MIPDELRKILRRHSVTESGCWEWNGARSAAGYGLSQRDYTHRLSYVAAYGPIPEGLEIDHLCRNRACFNPDHLEAVTHAENMRRGYWATKTHCENGHEYAPGLRMCRRCKNDRRRTREAPMSPTHCPQGHEFTPENTKLEYGKWRRCMACARATKAAYKARQKVSA